MKKRFFVNTILILLFWDNWLRQGAAKEEKKQKQELLLCPTMRRKAQKRGPGQAGERLIIPRESIGFLGVVQWWISVNGFPSPCHLTACQI